MTAKPKTDRTTASAADEFIWDTVEHTQIHHFVRAPITSLLGAHYCKDILDLGCGNGAFSGILSSEGFDVTGVDHSLSGVGIINNGAICNSHHILADQVPRCPDFRLRINATTGAKFCTEHSK